MENINYVTNLSLNSISGGWNGINYHIYNQLNKYYNINFIGPIDPKSNLIEKASSKIRRSVGLKGKFHFFSNKRLSHIAHEVNILSNNKVPTFFFGNTPWISCHPEQPYYLYLDAVFPTYMRVFSDDSKFSKADLDRIARKEEKWLNEARHIFWGSNWALNDAKKYYNIDNPNMSTIWVGGNISIPDSPIFSGNLNFTFISLNFLKKGGITCVEAFNQIKAQYPNAKLTIIGEKPPEHFLGMSGIEYAGLLKKTDPKDYARMTQILQDSFFLIHPTEMDTMGAVIIEAGYFGCPTVAPARFGIPELIIDQSTGILLSDGFTGSDIYEKIVSLIEDNGKYLAMRENVRAHTTTNLSWDSIGKKMHDTILKTF